MRDPALRAANQASADRRRGSRPALVLDVVLTTWVGAYVVQRVVAHHGHWLAVSLLCLIVMAAFLDNARSELRSLRRRRL